MTRQTFRIAYGRLNQESNALSPVRTTVADFEACHLLERNALHKACQKGEQEAEGFLKNAELTGFVSEVARLQKDEGVVCELIPTTSAWAVPGGPLTRDCFDELVGRIVKGVEEAGDLDGVYLSLHGAMGVDGVEGPEAEIVRRVRDVVGDEIPVVVTFDLHGNVTKELIDRTQAVIAYRTNPHRDHVKCGAAAARTLVGLLRKQIKTTTAWRSLPMLLGGGVTIDFLPPMRHIFKRMSEMEKDPRVLRCSTLMCHPWNDNPELGWSVVVITDGDEALAEKLADELANLCWNVRHKMPPAFNTPKQALDKARAARLRRKLGVVTISDASDVVTAGSTGENTALIRGFIEHGKGMTCYAGIRDPDAVEQLWGTPEGEIVDVTVGGKLDPASNAPLQLHAKLVRKVENKGVGRTLVLEQDHLTLVVVEGPALMLAPNFYKWAGLKLMKADVVMVKNYFPFLLTFLPYHRMTVFVKTQGLTDFDAAHRLDFAGPVWPKDDVTDWRPADARRRSALRKVPNAGDRRAA
jgi:microcystin degradation protein MlrC